MSLMKSMLITTMLNLQIFKQVSVVKQLLIKYKRLLKPKCLVKEEKECSDQKIEKPEL